MIRKGSTYRFSASDLAGHLACRHLTTLERQVADKTLPRMRWQDPMLEVLRERGYAHESDYLKYHRDEQQLSVVELPEDAGPEAAEAAAYQSFLRHRQYTASFRT